jgi:hypothetical protein
MAVCAVERTETKWVVLNSDRKELMSADFVDLMLEFEMAENLVAPKVAVTVCVRVVDLVGKMAELMVGLLAGRLDDKLMVALMVLY